MTSNSEIKRQLCKVTRKTRPYRVSRLLLVVEKTLAGMVLMLFPERSLCFEKKKQLMSDHIVNDIIS